MKPRVFTAQPVAESALARLRAAVEVLAIAAGREAPSCWNPEVYAQRETETV